MSRLLLSVEHCGNRGLLSRRLRVPPQTLSRCNSPVLNQGFNGRPAPYSDLRLTKTASTASPWPAQSAGAFLQHLQMNYRDYVPPHKSHEAGGEDHQVQLLSHEGAAGFFVPAVLRLVEAVQLKDERKALIYLKQALREEQRDHQAHISTLPRPFFTEIFRLLDPHHLSQTVDGTSGTQISHAMQERLNLGETVNGRGVRRLYVRLLDRLVTLAELMRSRGYELNIDEIACLLRCSGAASEPTKARHIWQSMVPLKYKTAYDRDIRIHTELIRARFLTEPLYTHYNKTWRMVTPRTLHRSRLQLNKWRVHKQDFMRHVTRLKMGLNGTVKGSDHVEDLMRVMRKRGSVSRLFEYVFAKNRVPMTQDLTCAFIIAFGRAGMLRALISNILEPCYGLRVPYLELSGGTRLRTAWASNTLQRTEQLMAAIVEAFGSNGEITAALELVQKISKENDLQIPTKVWTDLLEWTYIFGSRPVAPMWMKAGLPSKVPTADAIDLIWETMRASEQDVEPNFDQLSIMARAHLARGRRAEAYSYMKAALVVHEGQCEEFRAATYEYVQSLRDGALLNDTILKYERARFLKQAQWWRIQTLCRKLMSDFKPLSTTVENIEASQFIPAFAEEFSDFMPNPFQYRTATGYINLLDTGREVPKDVGEGYTLLPMRTQRMDQSSTVFRRRNRLFKSRRSLESQWSARLDPERLLANDRSSFRITGKINGGEKKDDFAPEEFEAHLSDQRRT